MEQKILKKASQHLIRNGVITGTKKKNDEVEKFKLTF